MTAKAILAITLSLMTIMAGCAIYEAAQQNPTASRLAVEQATLRIIDEDDARRARLTGIVEDVRAYIEAEPAVRVDQVMDHARDRIRWGRLSEADAALISALLDEAEHKLAERINDGTLDQEERVSLLRVLDWIEGAAHQ